MGELRWLGSDSLIWVSFAGLGGSLAWVSFAGLVQTHLLGYALLACVRLTGLGERCWLGSDSLAYLSLAGMTKTSGEIYWLV